MSKHTQSLLAAAQDALEYLVDIQTSQDDEPPTEEDCMERDGRMCGLRLCSAHGCIAMRIAALKLAIALAKGETA